MGAQVGILSLAQLQIHDHYNDNVGGPILTITRIDSANVRINSGIMRVSPAGVGAWAMMKRIQILQDSPGAMTLNYDLTRAGGAGTVHARTRLYRGTTLHLTGADNSTAAGPTTFTDAAFAHDMLAGDLIELWGYVSAGATTICAVEAFEVCYDPTITSIARWPVTVALALIGAGLEYTVIL